MRGFEKYENPHLARCAWTRILRILILHTVTYEKTRQRPTVLRGELTNRPVLALRA